MTVVHRKRLTLCRPVHPVAQEERGGCGRARSRGSRCWRSAGGGERRTRDRGPLEEAALRHQHERADGTPLAPPGESQAQAAGRRSLARKDDSGGGADKTVLTPIRWRVLVAWAEPTYRLTQRRVGGALRADALERREPAHEAISVSPGEISVALSSHPGN